MHRGDGAEGTGAFSPFARGGAIRRYTRTLFATLRASLRLQFAYPGNAAADLFGAALQLVASLMPLFIAFHHRERIAGWTREEALLVAGFFICLEGLLEAFVEPNLRSVVEHIRQGTLDHQLLKPVDTLFLVSVQRTQLHKLVHSAAGLALVLWAAHTAGLRPDFPTITLSLVLLGCSALLLHALWTMAVTTAFWFVRVDNLSWVLRSALDAARWPLPIYRGGVRLFLTWILPLGLMTTWPALALRGALGTNEVFAAILCTVVFVGLAQLFWRFGLRRYGSASS